MTLLRSSPLVFTSLLVIVACSDDKATVNPSSGNVVAASVSAGQGGEGGTLGNGGAAAGTGGDAAVTSTGGADQASTASTTVGQGGATSGSGGSGGSGGAGGAGGEGGEGGGGGSLPESCTNERLDDGETDVDCGGPICLGCGAGLVCVGDDDCLDLNCVADACVAGTCEDEIINAGESDVDCGGPCEDCPVGSMCNSAEDCVEGVCALNGTCSDDTCSDGVQNGSETGPDCGSSCPGNCAPGEGCVLDDDCDSSICQENLTCATPSCDDLTVNGDETSVDCGGDECNPCGPGETCGGAADCITNICTNEVCRCPTGMVAIPSPGFSSYCMDATEVTYGEYAEFVADQPPFDNDLCEFNVNGYTPEELWPPESDQGDAALPNYIQKPVRHVDWCDAAAYCSFKNKRLCGSIDGGPGNVALLDSFLDDQWYNACTALGTNEYPYGDNFIDDSCSESVTDASSLPDNVRQHAGAVITSCQGGSAGIYQMSGNIAEWVDACVGATGAGDTCAIRGGSFASTDAAEVLCSADALVARDTTAADIGFRCCL